MKLVRKTRLVFQENKSDKVYEVDLVEQSNGDAARYLVNFRFGRRGRSLNEGTKTVQPVTLAEAEALYHSVVVSKTNKGYRDENDAAPPRPAAPLSDHAAGPASQSARTAALLVALADEAASKKRARIIWSLGQSAESAANAVIAQVMRGEWIEDYAIAWTLGRWRDTTTLATLEQLQRHTDSKVKAIAFEALLLIVAPSRVANLLQTEKAELPPTLRNAIESNAEAHIATALETLIAENSPALNRALIVCYQLALITPAIHRALLAIVASCTLRPGLFKALRHIFKTAEMRIDYEMFACLAHRFDTTAAYFRNNWGRAYIPGQGSISVEKELKRDNSRLAYSHDTRQYLRRRAWRAMRRLGRVDSTHYVPLAKAVLLRVRDTDAVKPRQREVYRWVGDGRRPRRQLVVKVEYDEFAHLSVFNHILRGANSAYSINPSGTAWSCTGKPARQRGERFAHLWDQNLNATLDLLKQSRCGVVHDAAIDILTAHTDYLQSLSSNEIAELLLSPYSQTTQFALPLAQAYFNRGESDDNLLLALLKSSLTPAREFGAQILLAQKNFVKNQALLVELLLVFAAPIPAIVDAALSDTAFSQEEQEQIATAVVMQLLARGVEIDGQAAETLAQLLTRHFPAIKQMPLTLIDRLLSQAELGKQLLGARLLVANSIGFKEIPDRLLQHIHGSVHEPVRAIAVALLNKQSIDGLLQQVAMLAELYYRGNGAERRELLALLTRLTNVSVDNQGRVLHAMLGLTFRAEHEQGQADELFDFVSRNLLAAANSLDKDTIWRLLQAQSVTAQRVGSALLATRSPTEFSVRQWAKLSQHPDLAARQYAIHAFAAHEPLIKQHTRDALRLLDSAWDEVREFGFRYFRDRYQESDWSPEFIVGICDSTQPDVQAFGRELLQRFFQQQQGPHYLATLSEHPSVNVQLFVSHFLEIHAAGHNDRILNLRVFFITALSHINKARVCKDRVLQFLLREAIRDGEIASMAAEIFTRISLTVVRKDRSQLIKAMIVLKDAYPELALPISAQPLRPAYAEVRSGV